MDTKIDTKIKKLQEKIKELQDQQLDLDSSIEDIYTTINNWKHPEEEHITKPNKPNTPTILPHPLTNSSLSTENISYFIDYIISLNPTRYKHQPYAKRQALTFYNYLNQSQTNQYHNHQHNRHQHQQPEDTTEINEGNDKNIDIHTQREHIKYFLELEETQRETILQQCKSLNELQVSSKPKIFKILDSSLSVYHKKLALSKLKNLEAMDNTDSEYFKLSQWLDNLLDIPFNQYKQPAFMTQDPIVVFQSARKHLDSVIYGQSKTKQHILEIVARMISNPKSQGSVFAVEGEPGTGKTTLIKEGLSQVLGLPFIFISLGGAQDGSYLSGENYTYIGSKCGKIIQELKATQCMNPIFYFDELDKVSTTERGQEIINLLIHITDFAQNTHFQDIYLDGITVDLSRATFIFSFNDRNKISPVLLDRMEIIKFHSYSNAEKKYITEHYLLPNVIKQYFGEDDNKIEIIFNTKTKSKILDKILNKIIANNITRVDSNIKHIARKKIQNHKNHKKHNMLNVHYIMKRRMGIMKKAKYCNGGMRYIKRNLERIISKINIDRLEKVNGLSDDIQNKTKTTTKTKTNIADENI